MHTEDEDLHGGILRADGADRGKPAHAGHGDVEDHEVDGRLREQRQRFLCAARLGGDAVLARVLQQELDPRADQEVTVDDHQVHHVRAPFVRNSMR